MVSRVMQIKTYLPLPNKVFLELATYLEVLLKFNNLVILTSKNYTNSVFDHLGFLEKCATLFIDGNYKQTNTHLEHSNSNINPKQVKQTFAQEIEEKYFQIPSSSNVPEIKPSRRGSLRGGLQVCMK